MRINEKFLIFIKLNSKKIKYLERKFLPVKNFVVVTLLFIFPEDILTFPKYKLKNH